MGKSQTPQGRMYETYGRCITAKCRQCCNYQLKEKGSSEHVCIAYSETLPWNGMNDACLELFNWPFRGIRPRLSPLERMYTPRPVQPAAIEGQQMLF